MFETKITISFLSDWHTGSGLGDGAIADSILNRDVNGVPYLPGRSIKGALREGAWRLGQCRTDLAKMPDYLWGTHSQAHVSNSPGKITVGSGQLPQDIYNWLAACPPETRRQYVADMTMLRRQTALGKDKMVEPHSLRTIECGIPGVFFQSFVTIDAPALDQEWLGKYFAAVCAAVKSMGADRARGLGACSISAAGCEMKRIELPEPITIPEP